MDKKLFLAQPRGFCAGVRRAIATVERALALFGKPVYIRHEIVHNTYVLDDLRQKGAVFIEELDEAPPGSVLVFSAHGVSKHVKAEAQKRELRVFDATCPLVTKVHMEVALMRKNDMEVVVIGHHDHPEVKGTMGQSDAGMHLVEDREDIKKLRIPHQGKVAYVSQTTLSVDDTKEVIAALQAHFPAIRAPQKEDICYATTNRQEAVRKLAEHVSLIIVVGSPNSSNSNRLKEVADKRGIAAYMVDSASEIRQKWLDGHTAIGVTAGASAPEILVEEVVWKLGTYGFSHVEELEGIRENLSFPLPAGLVRGACTKMG
ncbi:MAG: 4-hydroxy-3-methylbut-2-enyl diphosphate reductase [Burkholderiaceae bacterium]|jgi:4-hydroxy-3-methylbut-2-enyl diphosphate reductase|nr:4-hydroxy-3-methylbut-2-enyl diphosphate reductase [Burkholderiaceae bacterium]